MTSTQIAKIEQIEESDALAVFTKPEGLAPYLALIRSEIDAFVPDISTKKGRDQIASIAAKVARSKTYLDGVGKALVDRLKEQPKLVDSERKRMRDLLDSWKDEVRKPLTDFEEREAHRVATLKERLFNITVLDRIYPAGMSAAELREELDRISATQIDDSWDEFKESAGLAKDSAVNNLKLFIEQQEKAEAEAAELARLRAEQAEKERIEREDRIAREAEERGRIEAERKARAELVAAEQAKIAAERKAEQEILQAEAREAQAKANAARAEQIARDRIESERRAAEAEERKRRENLETRNALISEAVSDLADILEKGHIQDPHIVASAIIEAIEFEMVRNIRLVF